MLRYDVVIAVCWSTGSLANNRLTPFDFEELNRSANGRLAVVEQKSMTRNDFRIAMLLRLGRVGYNDFALIDEVFERMDANNSGEVTQLEVVGAHDGAMADRMERMEASWAQDGCASAEKTQ